ncbi:MAG: zf-HC2 domain-containing protein [Fimbriimonas sp.]
MKCESVERLLSAALDGELSKEEAAAVESHLRECGRCEETQRGLRRVSAMAVGAPPAPPASLRARIAQPRPRPSRVPRLAVSAATVAVVVAVGAAMLTPSKAMAAYRRMWSSMGKVENLHMTTWSADRNTGKLEQGDTWVAFGSLRREGLRGLRGLKGGAGRATYDSKRGVYVESWSPERGVFVPEGAKLEIPPGVDRSQWRTHRKPTAAMLVDSVMQEVLDKAPEEVDSSTIEYQGRSVLKFTAESEGGQRIEEGISITELPMRHEVLVDPSTQLPVRSTAWRFEDGAWKLQGHIDWEFNLDLPKEMFTIESLQRRFADVKPEAP